MADYPKLPFNGRFLPVIGNAISDLGYGVAQGGFKNGFGIAAERGAQMQPYRDQQREARKAESEKAATRSATVEWIKNKAASDPDPRYADIMSGLESGALDVGAAYNAALALSAAPAQKPLMEVSEGSSVFDPNTNQTVYTAPGGGPDPKEVFGFEKDLASQYASADPVKAYNTVRDGFERVQASVQEASGAGDMALLYGYMKMLDPGSVVRESEYATAAASGDFGEQVQGAYMRLATGQRLPDSQRQEFLRSAASIYQSVAGNLSDVNEQFTTRANQWGVNPEMFVRPPETYEPAPVGGNTMLVYNPQTGALEPAQ